MGQVRLKCIFRITLTCGTEQRDFRHGHQLYQQTFSSNDLTFLLIS